MQLPHQGCFLPPKPEPTNICQRGSGGCLWSVCGLLLLLSRPYLQFNRWFKTPRDPPTTLLPPLNIKDNIGDLLFNVTCEDCSASGPFPSAPFCVFSGATRRFPPPEVELEPGLLETNPPGGRSAAANRLAATSTAANSPAASRSHRFPAGSLAFPGRYRVLVAGFILSPRPYNFWLV